MRLARLIEAQPVLPSVLDGVSDFDAHLVSPLPVAPPPVRAVEAAELPLPERNELFRDRCPDLGEECRRDDADLAAIAEKSCDEPR
jgi:hypothetical protein